MTWEMTLVTGLMFALVVITAAKAQGREAPPQFSGDPWVVPGSDRAVAGVILRLHSASTRVWAILKQDGQASTNRIECDVSSTGVVSVELVDLKPGTKYFLAFEAESLGGETDTGKIVFQTVDIYPTKNAGTVMVIQ